MRIDKIEKGMLAKSKAGHDKGQTYVIYELDETYVYALFVICDTETFNVVLEALGYEDLADYLIKRNYVDEEGNPDLIVWTVKNMEEMSEIMVEKSRELEYWSKVTMKETGRT